jgi:CRISPR-associated exonuclease Cas4
VALTTGDGELVSIPLSALEHLTYCRRQAALIHVEATWTDNVDTVRGELAHAAVDLPGTRRRRGMALVRSLPVRSRVHGLHGVCDLVEIDGDQATPVEYKVGPYHPEGPADLQLAGQAVCLAEAGYAVPEGYIYSAADRRRHQISITPELIIRTLEATVAMRDLLLQDKLPPAHNDRRCRRCSLRDDCMPELTHTSHRTTDPFAIRPLGAWRD